MEPFPENVPLVQTPDAATLFEGQTWDWDGIAICALVVHNQNDPSFKNVWISQSLSYIDILLNCIPLKWLIIIILPLTPRDMEAADIVTLKYGYLIKDLGP